MNITNHVVNNTYKIFNIYSSHSFSAHTDFEQTSHFIRSLRPPNVVLVHGERNEVGRLKSALEREYECNRDYPIKVGAGIGKFIKSFNV